MILHQFGSLYLLLLFDTGQGLCTVLATNPLHEDFSTCFTFVSAASTNQCLHPYVHLSSEQGMVLDWPQKNHGFSFSRTCSMINHRMLHTMSQLFFIDACMSDLEVVPVIIDRVVRKGGCLGAQRLNRYSPYVLKSTKSSFQMS